MEKKVVTFADTVSVGYTLSRDHRLEIRDGIEWSRAMMDRLRFERRIAQTAEILKPVLLKKLSCIKGSV